MAEHEREHDTPPQRTPEQQVEWEARLRPRAALAAIVAGVALFAGQLGQAIMSSRAPSSSFLEALQRTAQPGPVDQLKSLQIPIAEYLSDHAALLLASFVVQGIGYFALAYALTFLAAVTKARREAFPKFALYLPVVGGVLAGVSSIGRGVGRTLDVSNFLDGARTVQDAQDIGLGGLSLVAEVIYYPASLALAAGIVIVSLQAMRAGLLTRFLGVMGFIVGALQVIQVIPLPLVQAYWFIAIGVIFLGRRPGGQPPAWITGREEPWPSQQEVAAARAKQRRGAPAPEPEPEPEPVPATGGGPSPATSRKKRKRRS
jgi:hypothetical protein